MTEQNKLECMHFPSGLSFWDKAGAYPSGAPGSAPSIAFESLLDPKILD